ncbi:hypothetical protein [Paenibacillus sp. CF384]|uniref:hypothetical protein n=1 Tax=Paenibacillus sp. CF384 TaxID=1884382 RepID=UPI00089CD202|nr:hypothetical protein [Paenibacillus sp. CF384]SDW86627.1 hypothetical protein SAMN05518855_100672 [Paenibacillus sp. CF384]
MNRFMKLLHMEVSRFWKLYITLFVMTLLMQSGGILYESNKYMQVVKDKMGPTTSTFAKFAAENGVVTFSDMMGRANLFILAPIALCIGGIALYVFLIWYREWMGKNMFIYRLLMLPTERRHLYLAKLSAILLFVFGLVAFQLLILPLEAQLFTAVVDPELRGVSETLTTVIQNHSFLQVLVPRTLTEFVLYYGSGALFVIILFTAILLERSYRLKGIVAGVIYIGVACLLLVAPMLIMNRDINDYLYPNEIFIIEFVIAALIGVMSLAISFFLMNKKISV